MKLVANKTDYGKHRLFGSLAWGLNGVIAGKLIDLYGMNVMFYLSWFWSTITCGLIVFCMPHNIGSRSPKFKRSPYSRNNGGLCRSVRLLMSLRRDYQFMLSLLMMVIYSNAMFIVDRILFIQMEQELGATKFMNGIATLCMLTVIIHR